MFKIWQYSLVAMAVLLSCSCVGRTTQSNEIKQIGPLAQVTIAQTEGSRYRLATDYSKAHRGLSVVVMKGGKVVFEQYDNGQGANQAHWLASGTKSFWGVLAAAAVDDGLLRLDERVSDTITEWRQDPRKSRITVRQLLNFTDGLDPAFRELNRPNVPNKFQYSIELEAVNEPGSTFAYGPSHLYAFGELLRRKLASRRQSPLQYLEQRILQPIGLKVSDWQQDLVGNPNMPSGAYLTAREWAKFGELIKNGGKWNGKQIVSSARLAECFVGSKANPAYGLTFWLNQRGLRVGIGAMGAGGFRPRMRRQAVNQPDQVPSFIYEQGPRDLIMAAGAGNQRLYIIPSRDLVIVRQGDGGDYNDSEFLARLLDGRTFQAQQ